MSGTSGDLTRGRLTKWGTALAGVLLSISLQGCGSQPATTSSAATPASQMRDACGYGLPSKVIAACGCNPVIRNLDQGLDMTGLASDVRLQVAECAHAEASGAASVLVFLQLGVKACITRNTKLDPDLKRKMLDVLDKYISAGTTAEMNNWLACHEFQMDNAVPVPFDSKPGSHRGGTIAPRVGPGVYEISAAQPLKAGDCTLTGRMSFADNGVMTLDANWSTSSPGLGGDSFWIYVALDGQRMIAGNQASAMQRSANKDDHWTATLPYKGAPLPNVDKLAVFGDC